MNKQIWTECFFFTIGVMNMNTHGVVLTPRFAVYVECYLFIAE